MNIDSNRNVHVKATGNTLKLINKFVPDSNGLHIAAAGDKVVELQAGIYVNRRAKRFCN